MTSLDANKTPKSRFISWQLAASATALICVLGFTIVPSLTKIDPIIAPESSHLDKDQGEAVGIGELLEGARTDITQSDALHTAAKLRAKAALPGAPDTIVSIVADMAMGLAINDARLAPLDPTLFAFVFRIPEAMHDGGGSLAREASAMGRVDVLATMVKHGLSTEADGGLAFWSALDLWSPETDEYGQIILEKASKEGEGVSRVHEEGFTSFEMASTVSLDSFSALISYGGNPWKHPGDMDETQGFPSVMERLSLHADKPGSLDLIRGVIELENLQEPSERALWNTVGNLADSALGMQAQKRLDEASEAAILGRLIEERFGAVPEQFWPAGVAALALNKNKNPVIDIGKDLKDRAN